MTARSYCDLRVLSPNAGLRLEALSPDNGNELVRDGAVLVARPYQMMQRSFRYQLIETDTGNVLWERWQQSGEGSPVYAFISNQRYAVVGAHYLDWSSEQLLFFTPTGNLGLVVVVSAPGYIDSGSIEAVPGEQPEQPEREQRDHCGTVLWSDEHVKATTAGPMWFTGSFATFPCSEGHCFFSLRTAWGRRLIVDLERMVCVADSANSGALQAIVRSEEGCRALEAMRCLMELVISDATDYWQRSRLIGALAVVIDQKLADAAPYLRRLESTRGGSSTSSHVLGAQWDTENHLLRSLARLALRAIAEEPSPGGNYSFVQGPRVKREELGQPILDMTIGSSRAWELARTAVAGASPRDVLSELGSPDFIRSESRKVGKFYVWSEVWEYDGPASTTRLTWSFPESSRRSATDEPRSLARIDVIEPPAWAQQSRLLAFL